MDETIKINSPQSVLLLGDIAAAYDHDSLSLTVEPSVELSLRQIAGKTSFLHFPDQNLHIELGQLTPLIPKATSRLVSNLINLSYALLLDIKINFGLDIELKSIKPINANTFIAGYITALVRALAKLTNSSISDQDLLSQCLLQLKQTKLDIPLHVLGASLYKGLIFTDPKQQLAWPIDPHNLTLFSLSLKTPIAKKLKRDILGHILKNRKKYYENLEQLGKLANWGSMALEKQDLSKFGEYLNRTHKLLTNFGLVNEETHRLCLQAMLSGALGAKYSTELDTVLLVCDQKGVEVKAELMKRGLDVKEIVLEKS